MSQIVHVSWLSPRQSVDLYRGVLDGTKIEHRESRPADEYFFVATEKEAQELKAKMERSIPRKVYTVLDENNKPLMREGSPVLHSEPEIAIIKIP
jgi:hypothetical protein